MIQGRRGGTITRLLQMQEQLKLERQKKAPVDESGKNVESLALLKQFENLKRDIKGKVKYNKICKEVTEECSCGHLLSPKFCIIIFRHFSC